MSVSPPPPEPQTGLSRPPAFQSPFWGGFECSTQRRPSGRRIDVIDATAHDRFAQQDYDRLAASGLRTARDGLRWHLIERLPGEYDFASALNQVQAAHAAGVQVVWDLLHYGFPDFVDPFSPDFPATFARYAAAAAQFLRGHTDGTLWLCPVNEISFTAWGGGDVGYLNPFAQGRGLTLKAQLVRAAIAGMDAAREVDPGVRFLHAEPLINVQPHPERPDEAAEAALGHESQFEALDMLLGRLRPELGGAERYVDVVGVNYYPYNQWWHHPEPPLRQAVPHGHAAHRPLRDLLAEVHARYGRPLVIAETGAEGRTAPRGSNKWCARWGPRRPWACRSRGSACTRWSTIPAGTTTATVTTGCGITPTRWAGAPSTRRWPEHWPAPRRSSRTPERAGLRLSLPTPLH
ncbi:beta-glucosidase [Deinococcus radiopugnans]|uniref:beta-glucosidase n=1 Tax=Deinococcus radiopugnans TaxID=57497 RepID=UPI0036204AAE